MGAPAILACATAALARDLRPLDGSLLESLVAEANSGAGSFGPLHRAVPEGGAWQVQALAFQPFGASDVWAHAAQVSWSPSWGLLRCGHSGWTWDGEGLGQGWDLGAEFRILGAGLVGLAGKWPGAGWDRWALGVRLLPGLWFSGGWDAGKVEQGETDTPWGAWTDPTWRAPDWARVQVHIPRRKGALEALSLHAGWTRPLDRSAVGEAGAAVRIHSCLALRLGWRRRPGEWTLGAEAGFGSWRWLQMRRQHAFLGATRIQGLVYSP